MAEKAVEKKENQFKKLLALDPIFINKFGPKLKKYAKIIYYVLAVLIGIEALYTIGVLFTQGITAFIFSAALVFVNFVIVRMFSEYLVNKQ